MLNTLIIVQIPTPIITGTTINVSVLSIIDDIYFLFTLKCINYEVGWLLYNKSVAQLIQFNHHLNVFLQQDPKLGKIILNSCLTTQNWQKDQNQFPIRNGNNCSTV